MHAKHRKYRIEVWGYVFGSNCREYGCGRNIDSIESTVWAFVCLYIYWTPIPWLRSSLLIIMIRMHFQHMHSTRSEPKSITSPFGNEWNAEISSNFVRNGLKVSLAKVWNEHTAMEWYMRYLCIFVWMCVHVQAQVHSKIIANYTVCWESTRKTALMNLRYFWFDSHAFRLNFHRNGADGMCARFEKRFTNPVKCGIALNVWVLELGMLLRLL